MSADEQSRTMWNALMAILQAEMTPTGRLSTVQDLRRGAQLWRQVSPAIGVQHLGYKSMPNASHRRLVNVEFLIVVGAASVSTMDNTQSPPVMTKKANLDDANALLDPILSDGSGNGVGPVLNDAADNGLLYNGAKLANRSHVTMLSRTWDENVGDDNVERVWSFASYHYVAETFTTF
jgi:hypothetical protein